MKYKKSEYTQVFHQFVDLQPEDYILLKIFGKIVAIKYNIISQNLSLSLTSEGDILEKPPFFEITREQIEDLGGEKFAQYTSIVVPAKYYEEAKKRLKGLVNL